MAGCFSLMGFTCLCTQTLCSSQAWCLPAAADLTHLFFPSISRSCLGGNTGSLSPHRAYTPSSKNTVMKVEEKSQLSGVFHTGSALEVKCGAGCLAKYEIL